MIFWMILKVALKSLLANKLRSILAMLGIIIGVGAVISMLAIGTGAQHAVTDRISAMGTNLLIVRPGQRGTGGVMSGTQQNLTLDDAQTILTSVAGVHAVAPVVGGNVQLKYFNKNSRVSLQGTSITYFGMRTLEIERGVPVSDSDVDRMARVCVIGPVTADNLFGPEDPIDKTIKLNGMTFRCIGVTKAKGDQGFYNPDDQVLIPYSTAMKQLLGIDYLREIDVQAKEGADLSKVEADLGLLMRKRHKLQEGAPDDVIIRNQAELLATASDISRTFTILLGGIAAISLLVGGIGIMNIMLVTVTERTREIGIRKAIGAKDRDILRQFLIESLLMSGMGGLIGVGFGFGVAEIMRRTSPFPALVEMQSVFLALGFSAAVGIFFGYYPALRAARLDPIEALRYE
jgi:putative ABC transport system permease protein